MSEFNNLPIELKLIIFDYVDFKSLIKICRLVSKEWRWLVDQVKFKELIIFDESYCYPYVNRSSLAWYPNYRPINLDNVIFKPSLDFITPATRSFNPFNSLKFLKIGLYLEGDSEVNFEILNQLVKLEHLEIVGIKLNSDTILRLPNLKILRLDKFSNREIHKLTLDANQLKVFCSNSLSSVHFISPESIEQFEAGYDVNSMDYMDQFINLEVLKCEKIDFSKDILSKFPKLKEIQIHLKNFFISYARHPNLLRLTGQFKNLLKEKMLMKRSDLVIYLDGVNLEMVNIDEYFDFYFSIQPNEDYSFHELHCKYYNQLASTMPYHTNFNYNQLLELYHQNIPNDFTSKFNNIKKIKLTGEIEDQAKLVSFLKSCLNLVDLRIYESNLNQDFYDNLDQITHRFTCFWFRRNKPFEIKLEKLLKFKLLTTLILTQELSIDFVLNCFKSLKSLYYFQFLNNERKFFITKSEIKLLF